MPEQRDQTARRLIQLEVLRATFSTSKPFLPIATPRCCVRWDTPRRRLLQWRCRLRGCSCVGIHWPSTLTEDEVSVDNYFQALSFYTMEKRADAVGVNVAYTLLRLILDAWTGQPQPLNIHLLGHSFGAKVVCAALERVVEQSGAKPIPANVVFDLALLEAAFDDDELEPQNEYGRLAGALPDLRVLVSHSDEDTALSNLYPTAHRLARLLGKIKPAMGHAGPSPATDALFGGAAEIDVAPGFAAPAGGLPSRLTVADLTKLHQANPGGAVKFSGHHSDIFYPEIYALLSAFYKLS